MFTIKQGEENPVPSLVREALKRKWRMLIVDKEIDISVLDDFIDSNFKMIHQTAVVRRPYSFKITKQRNLKGLVKKIRAILDDFVVEESKADKIVWLHAHVSESLSYTSVSDYMKRN